jgi:formylglycine-generating enzyme required for sulfatase activity
MESIRYSWNAGDRDTVFELAFVRGTHGDPYSFGERAGSRPVEIQDFFIGAVPVTQALWTHVMGANGNPAAHQGTDLPLENVPWDETTRAGGFLDRINESPVRAAILAKAPRSGAFRLPSETEWEYAARGGRHWPDGFRFSGSDNIDAVAWYDRKHGDHTQPVGRKDRISSAYMTCRATSGNGAKMFLHPRSSAFLRMGAPSSGLETSGFFAVAAFTIGRSTARCRNATK